MNMRMLNTNHDNFLCCIMIGRDPFALRREVVGQNSKISVGEPDLTNKRHQRKFNQWQREDNLAARPCKTTCPKKNKPHRSLD